MANVVSEQCPTCGAVLKFDAKKDIFKCNYCDNQYSLEKLNEYKKKYGKLKELKKIENINGYNCPQCGAQIITGENVSSTSCVYCKNTAILFDRLTDVYEPTKIITFKHDKKDAIEAFKKKCKGRPLLPKGFNDEKNIQDMEGLYVPFWLYNCQNDVDINAECTRVKSWSTSSYYYTKTDYYDVDCNGILQFEKVPTDGSSRFDDVIMNAIEPFNYDDFKDFNMSYLSGYISEKYDIDKDKAFETALKRIEKDSSSYALNSITGYSSKRIQNANNNVAIKKTDYVLLPVYVLNIKYKDKIYHFAYNGQTGKMVGEIPVDKKKMWFIAFICFIISIVVMILLFQVQGYRWTI